jgi:hypothetical protein
MDDDDAGGVIDQRNMRDDTDNAEQLVEYGG